MSPKWLRAWLGSRWVETAILVTIMGKKETTMATYAELRQRVLATLQPGADAGPVLWGLASAACQGGVQAAAIDLVTIGRPQRHAPGHGFRLTPDQARRIARP
jgi:hypothetical protein